MVLWIRSEFKPALREIIFQRLCYHLWISLITLESWLRLTNGQFWSVLKPSCSWKASKRSYDDEIFLRMCRNSDSFKRNPFSQTSPRWIKCLFKFKTFTINNPVSIKRIVCFHILSILFLISVFFSSASVLISAVYTQDLTR